MRLKHLCWLWVALAIGLSAQEPAFEVASVKPSKATSGGFSRFYPPGAVEFFSTRLDQIIARAYGVELSQQRVRFVGGPEPLLRSRFDLQAKGDPANDSRAMLRTLLKERFGLRVHTEVRQVPLYALTVKEPGTLGRWLKPTDLNCREWVAQGGRTTNPDAPEQCRFSREQRYGAPLQRDTGTMNDLIVRVAQPALRLPVVDMTGLQGRFAWEVAFLPQDIARESPTIFTAFEDQLGLKVERTTGPWEVIVIDDVGMPTPN